MSVHPNKHIEAHDGTRSRALRVLCAEDDASLAKMLTAALEWSGFVVECVDDGHKALLRISAEPTFFNVLVTDHQMPSLSGLGLIAKLRDTAFTGSIIVHSSDLTPAECDAYRALAVDEILSKPVQLPVLLSAIRRFAPPQES